VNAHLRPMSEVVAALRRGLGGDLIAVVLFGSRARGQADEASDWDLLLVARHLPEGTLDRHMRLKKLLPPAWRAQTAILAKTPHEFESYLPSVYLDIALDGILLYDSDGYMASRLSDLKGLIEKKGLHRERVQDDLVWRWERFPGYDWALEWESTG
jgi:predicted nucleotidyltransferase